MSGTEERDIDPELLEEVEEQGGSINDALELYDGIYQPQEILGAIRDVTDE